MTRPCAFAQIEGSKILIIDLHNKKFDDDKDIRRYVTTQMGWETDGVAVLLYLDEFHHNFISDAPKSIHCFMDPDMVSVFFAHAPFGIEFFESLEDARHETLPMADSVQNDSGDTESIATTILV
ncbi:hypothetical protein GGI15_004195 [Coemansia interrupta]|uniref:Uncharacterized protein n=1 Tax=Coemansia interrupta TaxID=1126814 RepID=A0A9W8LGM2_9FUNG|nr:hypothetical protein GGI15_004195 [Coemansia interrupta]